MTLNYINNEYFEWLYSFVCKSEYSSDISFRKLLIHLHDTEFRYLIPKDKNRAEDGKDLRYRFAITCHYDEPYEQILDYLSGPCSVLEMMVALSIRCEENIMDDPNVGNRTSQWFWGMVVNLGLGSMTDTHFDKRLVTDILETFLDREYEPSGRGGLFTVRGCDVDLRDVEIWHQLCWYLDSIYM